MCNICELRYIEMSELLPESWLLEDGAGSRSYVAYLADKKSAYQTITTYLAAVRYLQTINNVSPTPLSSMFTLQLVMKGARRSIINKEKPRLPITPTILRDIRALWSRRPHDFDIIMVWAACCMAFGCFFRFGEITVPSASGYDPQQHLSFGDVSVDSRLYSPAAALRTSEAFQN